MNKSEYRLRFDSESSSPGWEAIDSRLEAIYRDQVPKHWGTLIKHRLGGNDPIDGISAYQCTDGGVSHLHFITYGYSNLYYDEDAVGGEYSGFGFEMTFRLASDLPPQEQPIWVCNLLQNIARYVFESGNWFEEYHWMPANGPICLESDTDIVGFAFLRDPKIPAIDTPHGLVEFIQAFGITQAELDSFRDTKHTAKELVERHRKANSLLITDLSRTDV